MFEERKGHRFTVKMNPGGAQIEAFRQQELVNGARNALRAVARRNCKYCESPETHKCSVSTMVAGLWLHRFMRSDTPCEAPICCTMLLLSDDKLLKEIGYRKEGDDEGQTVQKG